MTLLEFFKMFDKKHKKEKQIRIIVQDYTLNFMDIDTILECVKQNMSPSDEEIISVVMKMLHTNQLKAQGWNEERSCPKEYQFRHYD